MMRMQFLAGLAVALALAAPASAEPDWKAVAQALGKEGAVQPGGVYRVGLPRTDLQVSLDGVDIKAGLALGSWLAFMPMGNEAMVMGDLVLTGDEVNPVMKKLLEGGIDKMFLAVRATSGEPAAIWVLHRTP
jgi:hypothetical protein